MYDTSEVGGGGYMLNSKDLDERKKQETALQPLCTDYKLK